MYLIKKDGSAEGKNIFSDIIASTVPIENEFGELEPGLNTMFVSTSVGNTFACFTTVLNVTQRTFSQTF